MLESNTYLVLSLRTAACDEERKRGQAGVATLHNADCRSHGGPNVQLTSGHSGGLLQVGQRQEVLDLVLESSIRSVGLGEVWLGRGR